MLELKQIFLDGEHGPILKSFDLSVGVGEAVALVGLAGSGCSAVLAVASGAVQAHRGRVRFGRVEFTRRPHALREHTGLSDAELMGPFDLSVEGWLSYWSSAQGVDPREAASRQDHALHIFGLEPLRAHSVSQLSQAQRRNLDLARLRVFNPTVYLLDHPCAFMDGFSFWKLVDEINHLKRQGHSFVIATNEYNLPAKVCDRAIFVEGGDPVEECEKGSPRFKDFVRRSLGWKS
jgi:ABC-type multidrug transport system ATPase subunit